MTTILAELENSVCKIEFSEKKIFGKDLKDTNNLPAFFNRNLRGLKKAWAVLATKFTPTTTMNQAMAILNENGIKCHSWCMMD